MEFRKIEVGDYPQFLRLYNQSFKPAERRLYKDEKELNAFIVSHQGKFHAFAAEDGGLFLGFLSYWEFPHWIYIEHFAVEPEHRGKRIGSLMLQHLMKTKGENVLIEVERPEDSDKGEDRIRFYERNGFRLVHDFEYVQPPYSAAQKAVPMKLMVHGDVKIKNYGDLQPLLREVYGVS